MVRSIVFLSFLSVRSIRALRWSASLSPSALLEFMQPMMPVREDGQRFWHEGSLATIKLRDERRVFVLSQGCE